MSIQNYIFKYMYDKKSFVFSALIIKITGKPSILCVHIDDVLIALLRKEIIFAEVLSLKILIGMRSKTDFFYFFAGYL
jgi:hypothetical protein